MLRIHVEALFTGDTAGRLVRANEPDGKPAPRFFMGRTGQGNQWWFRNDLPPETVRALEAVCISTSAAMEMDGPPDVATPFESVLAVSEPVHRIWTGPAYHFPNPPAVTTACVRITLENADVLVPHLDAWRGDVMQGRLLFAVVVQGEAVSICGSVRQTAVAHEAGVETAEGFRGKGYGAQAVSAWAAAVWRLNRLPLYSTSWANGASRALARKLGLVQFASDLHIT